MTIDEAFKACRARASVRVTEPGPLAGLIGVVAGLSWGIDGDGLVATLRDEGAEGMLGPVFGIVDVLDLERVDVRAGR